jgi:hypothetical protein
MMVKALIIPVQSQNTCNGHWPPSWVPKKSQKWNRQRMRTSYTRKSETIRSSYFKTLNGQTIRFSKCTVQRSLS